MTEKTMTEEPRKVKRTTKDEFDPTTLIDVLSIDDEKTRLLRQASTLPEVRLMVAVLEESIKTLERAERVPTKRNLRQAEEVHSWMDGNRTDWLYGFGTICDTFGLDSKLTHKMLSVNVHVKGVIWRQEAIAKREKENKEEEQ